MNSVATEAQSIGAYGPARSTVHGSPLEPEELRRMQAYWHATLFLSAGMIYLRDNPLLREPLKGEHIKRRLLGHWGSDPGMSLTYIHLNRLIKKYDLNAIFLAGPGHGAPALLSSVYLEGTYSEIYVPDQKAGPDHCEKKPGQDRPDHANHLPSSALAIRPADDPSPEGSANAY